MSAAFRIAVMSLITVLMQGGGLLKSPVMGSIGPKISVSLQVCRFWMAALCPSRSSRVLIWVLRAVRQGLQQYRMSGEQYGEIRTSKRNAITAHAFLT